MSIKSNQQNLVKKTFSNNPTLFINLIQDYYPLTIDMISEIHNLFKEEFSWTAISKNPHINFNGNILFKYCENLNWDTLSNNESNFWTHSLIDKFKDYLDWNGNHPFAHYQDSDNDSLSTNEGLPWSENLIDKYSDKWDYIGLSINRSLPWSESLIDKYYDKWDWGFLSSNEGLPWSKDFIIKYENKLDWTVLAGNPKLPWSISLLFFFIENKDRWKLKPNYMWNSSYINKGFLYNEEIPWDDGLKEYFVNRFSGEVEEIELYELNYYEWDINTLKESPLNKFNYYFFEKNSLIQWDEEMIHYLAINSTQGWSDVSRIISLPLDLIEKFTKYLDWNLLSKYNSNIGDFEFLVKYEQKINFRELSMNKELQWDIRYLRKNKNVPLKLHWGEVNNSHNLPFSVEFIHEFSDKLFRSNQPTWDTLKDFVNDQMIFEVIETIKNN